MFEWPVESMPLKDKDWNPLRDNEHRKVWKTRHKSQKNKYYTSEINPIPGVADVKEESKGVDFEESFDWEHDCKKNFETLFLVQDAWIDTRL
jgi:hypothetical protein